jgi:hypothetical protein
MVFCWWGVGESGQCVGHALGCVGGTFIIGGYGRGVFLFWLPPSFVGEMGAQCSGCVGGCVVAVVNCV